MGNGRKGNLGNAITIAIVAALLGLLLILNAKAAEEPLRTIDMVAGAVFMLSALIIVAAPEGR